ncbi:MAG: AmmeMemoRadiSam system radical SAM enzyme [Marinilabiliales bacterium]|nr:MAG: AmmeMemoRadiSam system radical SAM enzyme [Marinilabiliales bacterium]
MLEARYYKTGAGNKVTCLLCPHSCSMEEGAGGKCRVRINNGGRLLTAAYGYPVSMAADPIEKKPLYHFFPGRDILSIGTAGCNFNCIFCQNHTISQASVDDIPRLEYTAPLQVAERARKLPGNVGIAFTYNEPVVWYEYMYDIAVKARERGLKNVVVSNGYINSRPLGELLEVTDAFNIDLKSFSDVFYRKVAGGSLAPVKSALQAIRKRGLHLEITHLVVTGLNDDEKMFREMTRWIAGELGTDTVLHISRYFPSWRCDAPATPLTVMEKFYGIAAGALDYVYTGNMPALQGSSDTRCAGCGTVVIRRSGYSTDAAGIDPNGNCRKCGTKVVVAG